MDMVSLLLSHPHIDPNILDRTGMTPIHLACSQGRDKIVRFMGISGDLEMIYYFYFVSEM